jgi:hypothetical protein
MRDTRPQARVFCDDPRTTLPLDREIRANLLSTECPGGDASLGLDSHAEAELRFKKQ